MPALKEVGLSGGGRRPWGHPGGTSSSFSPGSLLLQSCRHTAIFHHLRCHCLKVKSQVLTVSLELTFPAVTVSMPGGTGSPSVPCQPRRPGHILLANVWPRHGRSEVLSFRTVGCLTGPLLIRVSETQLRLQGGPGRAFCMTRDHEGACHVANNGQHLQIGSF